MTDEIDFNFFSNRLLGVFDDYVFNTELYQCLNAFEMNIYGILLQYNRIVYDLEFLSPEFFPNKRKPNANLDIYFYILTWDKLKKVFDKIKCLVNKLTKENHSMNQDFINDFRLFKKRIDSLFSEFNDSVRNEYEHPTMKPYDIGNVLMWGTILIKSSGDISAHVGDKFFAIVKKNHCVRIQALHVNLIDLFLKHFSTKRSTQDLIKVRDNIDSNIESIIKNIQEAESRGEGNIMETFRELILYDIDLSREGVHLKEKTIQLIHSLVLDGYTSN